MKLEARRRKNNDRLKKLSPNTHGNKYVLLKKKERFEETVMFAFSLIFHKHFNLMCIISLCLKQTNTSTKSVEIYVDFVEAICWLTHGVTSTHWTHHRHAELQPSLQRMCTYCLEAPGTTLGELGKSSTQKHLCKRVSLLVSFAGGFVFFLLEN